MKTRKLTAILLALCMLLSLSISAFAADDAVVSGTIPDSKITWELDGKGWLTISGSGNCSTFTSKDDQPWAEYRSQITQVWFDGMESLAIPDLAYWFEDCTNLTTAEIPSTTPVIGRHAFYNCPLLAKLSIYYGEHTLDSIGEDAFWRETDNGDTLYVAYIIGYPDSSVPFHDYDWTASNRSNRYFHDLYGVYQNADAGSAATNGIKKAPGISVQSTGSIIGNCPSCGKYSFQGTYVEVAHSSRGHANYNECYLCHYVQYLGTYTYKSHGAGGYGSGTCPDCGSHTWVLQSQQASTCTSNGYRSYSCACGQTKSETIYSSGHSYSYGSWEEYSSSQHRRESYCRNCGASSYDYASHSLSYGSWSNDSSSQHSRTVSCHTCGYSITDYGSHSYSTGSWSKYSDTQHRRSKTCSGWGASTYDYADHTYTYGRWTSASDTQHKRTKTCSVCKATADEYADHTDANADGICDDCGANVALIVTWDASSNGGSVGGKNSVTTSVAPNQAAVAPGYTPVKAGHTFSGWYTEKAGGVLYSTVTITAARTFYAQFAPAEYKITWDLGTGKTETTNQTYGEKLNLPTEPTRRGYAFLGWFTQETGGTQVDGNTVFKEVASTTYYQQMMNTKRRFHKTDGRQCYHIVQSFKPDEISPELAHEIAKRFAAEHLQGYEAVIGTHVDKGHIHSHIVFNSVNADTGIKYHSTLQNYYQQIRGISDRLCAENGLSVILQGERTKTVSYIEWLRQSKGQPTFRSMLEADLRDAITDANDLGHFFLLMEHKGYEIHHGNRLGFRLRGQERYMYPERKNAAFSEENIERAIAGNLTEIEAGIRPAFIQRPKPQPYRPHPKYKGFLALYYHYCYLLGRIEKRQYPPRMTPHLRREIMKAETYKARLKFLQENGISTADDLTTCMQRAENAVTQLAKQRTILNVRKKKRKKLFDALAAEESLAVSKALYEEGLSGMESEYAQYAEAKAILDTCGVSRQALTEEKADIYEQLAQLNKQIRAERQKIKLCREIADSTAKMQQDIAAQEKSLHEKETAHLLTNRR